MGTGPARAVGIAVPWQRRGVRARGMRVRLRALDPAAERSPIEKAVERYARAQREVDAMHSKGLSPVFHQRSSLDKAARDIDALRSDGAKDLATALRNDPSLTAEAAEIGRAHV